MPFIDFDERWRATHLFTNNCNKLWCRLHFYPQYGEGHMRYPFTTNSGVEVHCGPGAYSPRAPRKK